MSGLLSEPFGKPGSGTTGDIVLLEAIIQAGAGKARNAAGLFHIASYHREEMLKILSIVEQLMQMHVAALKELGIDLEKVAKQAAAQAKKGKAAPLEGKLR